jgi:hypothetical protein
MVKEAVLVASLAVKVRILGISGLEGGIGVNSGPPALLGKKPMSVTE